MTIETTDTPAGACTDATLLETIIPSRNVRKTLKGYGLNTVGDVRAKGIGIIRGLPGIGEVSLEALRVAVGVVAPAAVEPATIDSWEEGPFPLHLHSPHRGFQFPLKKARLLVDSAGGTQEQSPLWVSFEEGEAKLTSREWFLKIHDGDEVKAERDVAAGKPWRLEALAWLRTRSSFRRGDFAVKTD